MSSSDWIKGHYLELQKKYANMFVAIKGDEIIAYGKSLSKVLKKQRISNVLSNLSNRVSSLHTTLLFPFRKGRLREEIEKDQENSFKIDFGEAF